MVWERLLRECSRVEAARRASLAEAPTGADLLRALTRQSGDGYSTWVRGPVYAPFISDLIAEPPLGHSPVPMLEFLPEQVAEKYVDVADILRDRGSHVGCYTAHERGHFDSILGERREWLRYLRRPEAQALWRLRPAEEARATLSVAAVEKSSGTALRKILMSIPFNEACLTPSEVMGSRCDYGLVGGAALAQVAAHDAEFAALAWDQSNAFSMVVTPESWWPFMAGPPIHVYEADPAWVAASNPDGAPWSPSKLLRPLYTRLGMGHTHAAWILMQLNLAIIRSAIAS